MAAKRTTKKRSTAKRAVAAPIRKKVTKAKAGAKPRLTRAKNTMPADVRAALEKRDLMDAYHARPPFQRNDYLGWIARAARDATKQKRLDQMLDELRAGNVYMNMKWSGGR